MIMIKSDLSNAKIGDYLYSYSLNKWGKLIHINENDDYLLGVEFENGNTCYTIDGRWYIKHLNSDLFVEVPEWCKDFAPPKPC